MASHGLHFRKVDLHVHTPASRCYKYPAHSPEEWVQAALAANLDAVAVTDHNSADWIDRIRAAAQGTPLTVFPGVELSTHEGYHIVALFDVSASRREVELFIGAAGMTEQGYGRSETLCRDGVYKILDLIHERGGLAVLAHIDAPKGAYFELATKDPNTGKMRIGIDCVDLFNKGHYDAVEVKRGALPDELDAAHQIKAVPTFYQASDNPDRDEPTRHSKEGIGACYSLFALDEITLEGLRQCFSDPEVRIRQMGQWQEHGWPHLEEMAIGQGGFLDRQKVGFHPGLNSVIGGKGTGKSLVVEFIRFALGQPSENQEIRKDYTGKLDRQLGALNTVEIIFQLTSGAKYHLKHTYRGNGESSFDCRNDQTGERYDGDIGSLFPILAYSQTEVIKIAENEDAQLRLVDSLIDPRPFRRKLEQIEEQLAQNDQLVVHALEAREKANQARTEIGTLIEQIADIDRRLASPLLDQMKLAEAKKGVFESRASYLKQLGVLTDEFRRNIDGVGLALLPLELASDPILRAQTDRLSLLRQRLLDEMDGWSSDLHAEQQECSTAEMSWIPEFDTIKEQYEVELKGSDKAELETERRRLVAEKERLQQQFDGYRKLAEDDLPRLLLQRGALLDALDTEHQEFYTARKSKFDELTRLSDGRLKLGLQHASNLELYRDALVQLLKGSTTSTITVAQRNQIAKNVPARQLGDVIIVRDVDQLSQASQLSKDACERAMDKLWASDDFGAVLAIQHSYYPQDTPTIWFNKGNDQFAELKDLSVGQKCTALLIIALCDGEMPVVIDQPEDALDIASVWEDIAKKLRRGKYGRQFIMTTHNSTLAVGSDSDSFIVLTPAGADRAKVSAGGAIDRRDVRDQVVAHLEGGPEPYKLRQRKLDIR